MRRAFWILLTPLAGFLVLWLATKMWIGPELEKWALTKTTAYINTNFPVQLKADHLSVGFFKPFLSVEGISVSPKDNLSEILPELRIKDIQVFIDFFHLLSGRLTISAIVVNSPTLELNIDPLLADDSPRKELPLETLFSQTEQFPLQRLFLNNLSLKIHSQSHDLQGEINHGHILIINQGKSLIGKTALPDLSLKVSSHETFRGSLESQLLLTRQYLRVIQLEAHLNDSEISAHGELSNISKVLMKPAGFLNTSAKLNLSQLHDELKKIRPSLKFPTFSGEINLDMETRFTGLENTTGKVDINTRALKIDEFELGNARIQGNYKDHIITLSEMKWQHPAGEVSITKTQLSIDGNFDFDTKVAVTDLELQKLFETLNLTNIPVGMNLQAELPCAGQVLPTFRLTCTDAQIKAKDLWVKSGMTSQSSSILAIENLAAKGQIQITPQNISYAANISLGSSLGTSDGNIVFNKGFAINYKTPKLNFKDIKNLANLNMQGFAAIEGSTTGDSAAAIFDMNFNGQEFLLDGFSLGSFVTQLKYRKGHLLINDLVGALNRTQYLGHLDINLDKENLQGEFRIPTVDLADVAIILKNTVPLPVQMQGLGKATAFVEGPLDFWKLNYQLESAFKKVRIGSEIFDQLLCNISAKNGNINPEKILLKRGQSTLSLQGNINSDQTMNLHADGKNWKLEESNTISAINSNIGGNLNFNLDIKDSIKKPKVTLNGAITETLFEDQEMANSNFSVDVNSDKIKSQLLLFGNKIEGEVQVPTSKSSAPLIVKIKTHDWDYSSLLGLIGGANLASEYTSGLTSAVDLRSENGQFFSSTGKVRIETFNLKRGPLSFENQGPIELTSDNGLMNLKNFVLSGPKNTLQIRGDNFTAQKMNVALTGKADLRLLQIFLPFLDDLGGPLSAAVTVSGKLDKPEILGTLNTDNAFLKIKNFPHPIDRLSTEVIFSQSKILINNLKAQIAGGSLIGEGQTLIEGLKNLPTSVRLHLEGITINVPDRVRSSGSAELLFAGNWFPFVLSGTYRVSSAVVDKEFTEDGGGTAGVKQSIYLPRLIREGQFEPVLLDLQVILEKNIVVKNSLIDGSVTGQLQVKGSPGNPILLGKINMEKKSKLIFKDKIFEVLNGVIDFDDPNEVNPLLYISAQSRINDYDVSLLAQGPSKNLGIRLTSIPPLPEQDIISLIALGMTTSTPGQSLETRQQAEKLGVEIGGAVLAKPISKQLENTLGVNLQVTSQYDSTRNISVPKITLSRRLTEKIKVSGSRPVGNAQSYDLKLEYLLNNNVTAVGSFQNRGVDDSTTSIERTQQDSQSIFGLDLEFKREFK